jgi:hypothetical protein
MVQILNVEITKGRERQGVPFCSFKEGLGSFRFNRTAIALLDLKNGDLINFAFDDELNRFFVFKSNTDGYPIRLAKGGKEANTSCIRIVERIVSAYRLDKITDTPTSHRKHIEVEPMQFLTDDGTVLLHKIKLTEKE